MKSKIHFRTLATSLVLSACACSSHHSPDGGTPDASVKLIPVTGVTTDRTFDVMDHMIATVEMQLSGEPLAEAMGRDLTGYSRDYIPPNIYFDPSPTSTGPYTDLVGFSTAVESYEYSKQPMNSLAFESGAGISLVFGPLVNPTGLTGTAALALMQKEVQNFADNANTVTLVSWNNTLSNGSGPLEPPTTLGWPGFWPTLVPFTSFNPTIDVSGGINWQCSIASDDDPGAMGNLLNLDYECDYNSLHLTDRASQASFSISPGAAGWAGWKYALWTMNYLQSMHDSGGNAVATVCPGQLSTVGAQPNQVLGNTATQAGTVLAQGTYLGSSNIEGFQAANMINELDNAAQFWLSTATTTDGTTLSGFSTAGVTCPFDGGPAEPATPDAGPSDAGNSTDAGSSSADAGAPADGGVLAAFGQDCTMSQCQPGLECTDGGPDDAGMNTDVCNCAPAPDAGPLPLACDPTAMAALEYDWTSPLRWIPSTIGVTETAVDSSGFPGYNASSFSIQAADSNLIQLAGLLGAYSSMYALTDRANVGTGIILGFPSGVGGAQSAEAYFDGDPFPQDDQLPDGESTLHDRALGMIRFLVTDLDRIHADPTTGIFADDVNITAGKPTPVATTVATDSAMYTLMALRAARRTLSSVLGLYSNNTSDLMVQTTPLDSIAFNGAPGGATFTARLNALISTHASLFLNHLTTSTGQAYGGWNYSTSAPTTDDTHLDSYTAAIRGLLLGYLTTGDTTYRNQAVAVFNYMDKTFWDPATRVYNSSPGPMSQVTYTPRRFALVSGSLRDMIELVGVQPGNEALLATLEDRMARMNKLVLNGWDDRNNDGLVQYPSECIEAVTPVPGSELLAEFPDAGIIPHGGLQMAERGLSGDVGSLFDTIAMESQWVDSTDREQDCVPNIDAVHLPSALANAIILVATPDLDAGPGPIELDGGGVYDAGTP